MSVFLMYFCNGCHINEPEGLFGILMEIFLNKEELRQAPDIFVCNFIPFGRPAAVEASKHRSLIMILQANNGIPDTNKSVTRT